MSVQGFDPAHPSTSAPAQERAPTSSNSLGDMPTTDSLLANEIVGKKKGKKKALTKKVAKRADTGESVDDPAAQRGQYQYDPYRKAGPTPEPEGSRPADLEELDTLDATARVLFKSDREVLDYVEALNYRTAAILEYANRTGSQLRSSKGVRERIELYVDQLQETSDQGAHQQPSGDAPVVAKRKSGEVEASGSDESSDDGDDAPKQDLSPTLMHVSNENRALPPVGEHLFKNIKYPNLPGDYLQQALGESAPQSPNNPFEEDDLFRQETPPARQPSLPPGHEDENGLEYAEDAIETRSDFSIPPGHAAVASDDSTFNRSGADLRIASDTGLLFPLPDDELARISEEFKREAIDSAAALAVGPPADLPRSRHPLAQSYIPPAPILQPEPQYLVSPRPVFRTPSPSRTTVNRKRKRASTPEDEEETDAGNIAGPSAAAVGPSGSILRQVEASKNGGRVSAKRRRLLVQQQTWDHQMFPGAGPVPALPRADPQMRAPELSSQPAHSKGSLPPLIGTSQIQKESEVEASQVIGMLSQVVEQGESEDEEEPTGSIFPGFGMPRHSLPALTADDSQGTSAENAQSGTKTPAETQLPANVPVPVSEDVFGPVVLSVKANKISDRWPAAVSQKGVGVDVAISNSEHGTTAVSHKSTRFSLDGRAEKKGHKVFRKTPAKPKTRTSLRAIEAENAFASEIEAESHDTLNPLPSPEKKRAAGARTRKSKATPLAEPNPSEGEPPSISASGPPSKLRRGRSAASKPEAPTSKAPVRKSTRNRK